jgi:Cu(I)/Ag(I) efflux system periplasmic protein CusF
MFVCGNVSARQRARYLAWALVIGMVPALLPSGDARAQGTNMKDMPGMKKDMPAKKGEATKAATSTGTVTAMDRAKRKVTLEHGPIKKLDMNEGMTMVFRVQDPAMLKQVKVGDTVRFDADRVNGQFTMTKIEKAR